MRMPLFFLLVLYFANCFAANSNDKFYPVLWTSDVKIKSLQEIPKQLASENYVGQMINYGNMKKGHHAIAKTCQDFFRLKQEKYYPANNFEIAMESFFVDKCYALLFLRDAQPARFSYIRDFNLRKDYGLLPATLIFPEWGDAEEKGPEGNLQTVYPDTRIEEGEFWLKDEDKFSLVLSSKTAISTTVVSILAWGDFNHDGFDDMLISVANYGYHYEGSFHYYATYILTRKRKNAPLEIVKWPVYG